MFVGMAGKLNSAIIRLAETTNTLLAGYTFAPLTRATESDGEKPAPLIVTELATEMPTFAGKRLSRKTPVAKSTCSV